MKIQRLSNENSNDIYIEHNSNAFKEATYMFIS